jgi:hydrogenase maturation factor
MCFAVPYQVLDVKEKYAIIEGGKKILLGKQLTVQKGEYVQVVGNVAVGKLTKTQGKKVRSIIKQLNTPYE